MGLMGSFCFVLNWQDESGYNPQLAKGYSRPKFCSKPYPVIREGVTMRSAILLRLNEKI